MEKIPETNPSEILKKIYGNSSLGIPGENREEMLEKKTLKQYLEGPSKIFPDKFLEEFEVKSLEVFENLKESLEDDEWMMKPLQEAIAKF